MSEDLIDDVLYRGIDLDVGADKYLFKYGDGDLKIISFDDELGCEERCINITKLLGKEASDKLYQEIKKETKSYEKRRFNNPTKAIT